MRKEEKYFIGEESDHSEGGVIPDIHTKNGVIVTKVPGKKYRWALDFKSLSIHRFKLSFDRSEAIVTVNNGEIAEVQCSSVTALWNVQLERIDVHSAALADYKRIRDRDGREWTLLEGQFPNSKISVLQGSIEPEETKGFAAAMGRLEPHVFFMEVISWQVRRKWKLLKKSENLP